MTYEEFKIAMTAEVTNLAGEEVNVSLHRIPKNNGVILDALTVLGAQQKAAPTIYLKDFYMRYRQGISVRQLAGEIMELAAGCELNRKIPEHFFQDYSRIRKRICFKLINYRKNRALLNAVPHRRILDLAMVFYYLVEPSVMPNATILIRNTDMLRWHADSRELEHLALENTPGLLGWKISSMLDVLEDLLVNNSEEEAENFLADLPIDTAIPMYVVTNREKYFGAACILYPGVLKKIADQIEDNLYILPSSIHECIIVPASGKHSQKVLCEMVTEINEEQVEETEVLSDHVYFYDRMTESLSM